MVVVYSCSLNLWAVESVCSLKKFGFNIEFYSSAQSLKSKRVPHVGSESITEKVIDFLRCAVYGGSSRP